MAGRGVRGGVLDCRRQRGSDERDSRLYHHSAVWLSNSIMPRILLLVTDLNIGGTPTVVRELAIRLAPYARAIGGDVLVASLAPRGPVSQQIEKAEIAVHALDEKGTRDARVVARLHKLIARERIDTVFSFLVHANA